MRYLLCALLVSHASLGLASDKLLDFWNEGLRLFVGPQSETLTDKDLAAHRAVIYTRDNASLDHADHKVGDFSLVYHPGNKKRSRPKRFGFVAGLWGERWDLSTDPMLHLWVKVKDADLNKRWSVNLVDENNIRAKGALDGVSSSWQALSVSLAELEPESSFDWQKVARLEFLSTFGEDASVHLDGIRFEGAGKVIGVTDKSLAQRMAEAGKSREARIIDSFGQIAQYDKDSPDAKKMRCPACVDIIRAFAKFMVNEDLETANKLLTAELNKSTVRNNWSLMHTPLYCRFYYMFSNNKGKYPGRMTPENEKLLLETLWQRTYEMNDINLALESTWWLEGSENHDLNSKASALVSSRIFMDEPEYKDRVYPNYGFGSGYYYGKAGYYGKGVNGKDRHAGGRANHKDGKEYTAADHYAAWVAFFKNYVRERAERGFFLEYGAHSYTKHTLNFLDLAYQYSGDDELHQMIDDFLAVYWSDWAQVSISGLRGGPKTRHHRAVGGEQDWQTAGLVSFHLGGVASGGGWTYWNLINDFSLPPVVWRMVLDRQGMGEFTYRARGIGEEENVWPRPLGNERTLTVDTESRFLKSTYVTPDYTLGTQMDHPAAVHSHLSTKGRWHGMTFSQSPDARIVPVGLPNKPDHNGRVAKFDTEIVLQTAHHESTLVFQTAKNYLEVHPEWFPTTTHGKDKPLGIWFGKDWDRTAEKDGWVFVQKGNAYAAVRPVVWDEEWERANREKNEGNQINFHRFDDPPTVKLCEDCYSWDEDQPVLRLDDPYIPVIIEAGRKADYPTLEAFVADVLDNPLALYKTVVPGFHVLVYTGNGDNAKEIVFNAASPEIPTIGGEYIDYSYPMTFDSPYFKSPYKSGKITIEYGGDSLELDFSEKG